MVERGATSVELTFGDGEYVFWLPVGPLRELQKVCDAGPMELLSRLTYGTYRFDDVRETIRFSLIGGGLKPDKALELVRTYVDPEGGCAPPLEESAKFARAAVHALVVGMPDEPLGEPKAGAAPASRSPAESSPSPASTPRRRAPSGGLRAKSTDSTSGN